MKQILVKTPDDVVADVFVFSESVSVCFLNTCTEHVHLKLYPHDKAAQWRLGASANLTKLSLVLTFVSRGWEANHDVRLRLSEMDGHFTPTGPQNFHRNKVSDVHFNYVADGTLHVHYI